MCGHVWADSLCVGFAFFWCQYSDSLSVEHWPCGRTENFKKLSWLPNFGPVAKWKLGVKVKDPKPRTAFFEMKRNAGRGRTEWTLFLYTIHIWPWYDRNRKHGSIDLLHPQESHFDSTPSTQWKPRCRSHGNSNQNRKAFGRKDLPLVGDSVRNLTQRVRKLKFNTGFHPLNTVMQSCIKL